MQLHKAVHNRGPEYLHAKFVTNSNLCCAATRGHTKLHLLRPNTNFHLNFKEPWPGINCQLESDHLTVKTHSKQQS